MGRRGAKGNQKDFLGNICVILPIKSWDVLEADGTVLRTTNRSKRVDCMAFQTRYPTVLVELQWDSSDDLDLELIELGGTKINGETPDTDAGHLINENNIGSCGIAQAGKEAIVCDSRKRRLIQNGKYTVIIHHFNNCGNGPTKWKLLIMVDDKVVLKKKGRTNLDSGTVIATAMFIVNL